MLTSLPPPEEVGRLDLSRIAQDLQIRKVQVEAVVQLLNEGNTIPFITRYRKERTGGLDEEVLRIIQERVGGLRHLADRKQNGPEKHSRPGKTDRGTTGGDSRGRQSETPRRPLSAIQAEETHSGRPSRASAEKGLEPLALSIWNRDPAVNNLDEVLPQMLNPEKELNSVEDVKLGVQHILAEVVAESADVRAGIRAVLWDTGKLCTTKSEKLAGGDGARFQGLFPVQRTAAAHSAASHARHQSR